MVLPNSDEILVNAMLNKLTVGIIKRMVWDSNGIQFQ